MGNHEGTEYLGRWAQEREAKFLQQCREARERKGMSQRELARQMTQHGVPLHQSSIAKLEREDEDERRPLRLSEAIVLAIVLRVPLWHAFLDLDDAELYRSTRLVQELSEAEANEDVARERVDQLREELRELAQRDRLLNQPAYLDEVGLDQSEAEAIEERLRRSEERHRGEHR